MSITTLLGKVTDVLTKDFWFASFVPSLIFLSAVGATVGWVARLDLLWPWMESWAMSQKLLAGVVATLLVVIFGYVLSGLRPALLQIWTGTLGFPVLRSYFERRAAEFKREYEQLRADGARRDDWQTVFEGFRRTVEPRWNTVNPPAPDPIRASLADRVARLDRGVSRAEVDGVLDAVAAAYGTYSGESLSDVYRGLKTTLTEWDRENAARAGVAQAEVERRFGTADTIRATELGNVVEAYNAYAFKRYQMEAQVFWPRLRFVMPAATLGYIEEKQTLLSFAVAMASVCWAYSVLALIVGPWLVNDFWVWFALAMLGMGMAAAFYRLSVVVADDFGDLVRASIDLYRLDLMRHLNRPAPASLQQERRQWRELSVLAVYGTITDFGLVEKKS